MDPKAQEVGGNHPSTNPRECEQVIGSALFLLKVTATGFKSPIWILTRASTTLTPLRELAEAPATPRYLLKCKKDTSTIE
jgi:hypothetical protein